MKNTNTLFVLFLLLWFGFSPPAFSQVKLHVVNQNYINKVAASNLKTLTISAEKADIEISITTQNEVSYEVRIATKHPDKNQALADYKKMKFIKETYGQVLFLRSYLVIDDKEAKPKSNFDISYKIYVPESMGVTITNTFGRVTINGLSQKLTADLKFCTTSVQNCSSYVLLTTNYGTLQAENTTNDLTIKAKHTSIELEKILGKTVVDADFGAITLRQLHTPKPISIKANKTELRFEVPELPPFGINLASKNTTLDLPSFLQTTRSVSSKENYNYKSNLQNKITIATTFGSVTIKTVKP